jgi:methylglutaconyl-CoA hydratase
MTLLPIPCPTVGIGAHRRRHRHRRVLSSQGQLAPRPSLLRQLAAEIAALGANADARVIVVRSGGSGPFCAGASFDEFSSITSAEQGADFFSGFSRVILAMIRAPKFVVTRVHGKAAGGAVGLISASDYAIATTAASAR